MFDEARPSQTRQRARKPPAKAHCVLCSQQRHTQLASKLFSARP